MPNSDQNEPREQHNHSSGLFVGRDLKIETLDPKTKDVLTKLSKDAPELAILLAKALQDGVISPDVAFALGAAARNINADVAEQLIYASQRINADVAEVISRASYSINHDVASAISNATHSINEDVASVLNYASNSINPDVANQISAAATSLSEAVSELGMAIHGYSTIASSMSDTEPRLREWENVAEVMDGAADSMARASQIQGLSANEWSWRSFWWGIGVGFFAITVMLALWSWNLNNK